MHDNKIITTQTDLQSNEPEKASKHISQNIKQFQLQKILKKRKGVFHTTPTKIENA